MVPEYDRTIAVKAHSIRVIVEDGLVKVYHDRSEVASRRGDVGLLMFQALEDGRPVMYDIAILQSGFVRMFVGRNGILIYSDDPAVRVNQEEQR